MHRIPIGKARSFKILWETLRAQAAEMVIRPGRQEGGPKNRHARSDQWLFVTEGTGVAVVEGHRAALNPGVLLLIEKGEPHEIHNTGDRPLRSLNLYTPPAY